MRKPPMSCSPNVYPLHFPGLDHFRPVTPDWAQDNPNAPDYIKNKDIAEELRPVFVNGKEFLGKARSTGAIDLVAGDNIALKTDGNSIIISVTGVPGGGGGDPGCGCVEYVEGEGIDIRNNVISIEPGSIDDDHIQSISISKLVQDDESTIILNGGSIDG